ncbi:calcyphosin-like protein isoform X1 [Dermacentor silvarum]|nr:calcyphosin-like protein isoform X1 [Dermacentor silvarum]
MKRGFQTHCNVILQKDAALGLSVHLAEEVNTTKNTDFLQTLLQKTPPGLDMSTMTPIEKLRHQCLQRGAHGIKAFARQFRAMDHTGDKKLDKQEFKKGLQDFKVDLSDHEVDTLFKELDKDGNDNISFNEFLVALRPPMSAFRLDCIKETFHKMDKSGDGIITIHELKGHYNAREPKFRSGELTEDDAFELFLQNFDSTNNPDGKVTIEEFVDYYAGVSASVDTDTYFDLMMRNAWKF